MGIGVDGFLFKDITEDALGGLVDWGLDDFYTYRKDDNGCCGLNITQ